MNIKQWLQAEYLPIPLIALMVLTRFHHFGDILHLPDASLAVLFFAGFYRKKVLFGFLLAMAALIDYAAIENGTSSWCVSSAYVFLIPTYAVMWVAGRYCSTFKSMNIAELTMQLGLLILAASAAFAISNGSFYLFSGRQDVNDLSIVEAEGGIEVENVIGAAEVRSGADVVAGRGIAGGGRCRVFAAGVVRAGYITHAKVTGVRGVVVLKEILQSDVSTSGELRVDEGRIVGGQAVALEGIVVGEAGSEAATPTLLAAGEDPEASRFFDGREAELGTLKTGHMELQARIALLTARRRQMGSDEKERLTEMMFRAREMEFRMEEVRREIKDRLALVNRKACRQIRVLGKIHPRVTFRIAGQVFTVETPTTGPVTVTLDASRHVVLT